MHRPRRRVVVTATLLAAVAAALPPVALAQYPVDSGTLGASSSEISPGGTVDVSGGGFAPGSAVSIIFRSDPILLKTVSADSTGRIDTDVAIPRSASPGSHTLEARGRAAGGGTLVLTRTIEVLGAQAGGHPETGLSLLWLVAGGLAAVAVGATLLFVGRGVRRRG